MHIPETLEEVLQLKDVTYVSGATDLMPLLKNQVRWDENLVFLNRVDELRQIEEDRAYVYIGAGALLADIALNPLIKRECPAVSQAASQTASPQIRNMATIGGNIMQDRRCIYFNQSAQWRSGIARCFKTGGSICHQIPRSPVCRAIYYSDLATGLLVYDTEVEYFEEGEKKREHLQTLIERHTTANGLDCSQHLQVLLTRFCVPKQAAGTKSIFHKYCMRTTIDFPLVNFAGRYRADGETKIIVGAVSTMPIILEMTAEKMPDENISDAELLEIAVKEIQKLAKPIKEAMFSPAVKRHFYVQVEKVLSLRRS